MSERYVVNERGERVAVLLDVEQYERLLAQHHAPAADTPDGAQPSLACEERQRDEPTSGEPPEDEDLGPEEGERRITEFITSAD